MGEELVEIACFIDFDNTLYDNDGAKAELRRRLNTVLGETIGEQYWGYYEAARQLSGVVDIPRAFELWRPHLAIDVVDSAWSAIWDFPYDRFVMPDALALIAHFTQLGIPVGIVSDGDTVYQPHKIRQSGLSSAVGDRVQIYVHKEEHLPDLYRWMPAYHYLLIDDKPRIIAEMKRRDPARFTTILVQYGHYGSEQYDPEPDLTVDGLHAILEIPLDGQVDILPFPLA